MGSVVRTTSKGQVVIPAPIRRRHHIEKGTRVRIEDRDGTITVTPLPKDPVQEGRGMVKGGQSALKELLADREAESHK